MGPKPSEKDSMKVIIASSCQKLGQCKHDEAPSTAMEKHIPQLDSMSKGRRPKVSTMNPLAKIARSFAHPMSTVASNIWSL
mmetsp:Transcript_60586/g.167920  ORF Transcript_60586/g.167920 Transcript_60586/m.167920 type:complete len:81 (+) Transcript_60586:377-619(+)